MASEPTLLQHRVEVSTPGVLGPRQFLGRAPSSRVSTALRKQIHLTLTQQLNLTELRGARFSKPGA